MSTFTGIPADAIAFYRELSANNTKAWWATNKGRYHHHVREPIHYGVNRLMIPAGE